jgi:hypothetical protein
VFVESHPRRSPDSFLTLAPISCPLSPDSDISPAALSHRPAVPLSLLECAVPDKHRVLPVFSRNRPPLSPLECVLPSHLVSVDFKGLTARLTPLDATLTKNMGGGHLPQTKYLSPPPASGRPGVFPTYPLSFQTLAYSFAHRKNSTPFFSSDSALFAKNHPGWGAPASHFAAGKPGRSQW